MSQDGNRLLLRFDKMMRQINRARINEAIDGIGLEDLRKVATLVARSRAAYMKCMYKISRATPAGKEPTANQLDELKKLRATYEELLAASGAFEIAIKRGYLDIRDRG